jgi:hypothetical protein
MYKCVRMDGVIVVCGCVDGSGCGHGRGYMYECLRMGRLIVVGGWVSGYVCVWIWVWALVWVHVCVCALAARWVTNDTCTCL